MIKKSICIFLSMFFLLSSLTVLAANLVTKESGNIQIAEPTSGIAVNPNIALGQNNFVNSAKVFGLIATGDLTIYLESNRTLRIVANTNCTDVMDKVGFKDITIQRLSGSTWNNVTVWSAYKANSMSYLYDYRTTVAGGYYYRVTVKHYAEKGWWIFADTQEVYNETSALWIG